MGLPIIKTFAFSASQGSSQRTYPNLYIILHEVGVNNSPASNNASYFKHNWSSSYTYATYVVGHLGDYLVSDPGYVSWAALSANPYAPVQIEFERTSNKEEFKKGYANYVTLARYYAKKYGIPLTLDKGGAGTPGIKSHLWVTQHYGGDHTDPYGYLSSWGITKSQLAYDLAHGVHGGSVKAEPSKSGSKKKPSTHKITAKHINKGSYLHLPKDAPNWYVYPMKKSPVLGNQCGKVYPKKNGGETWRIHGWTQNDVAVIHHKKYGDVQIYCAPDTGATVTGSVHYDASFNVSYKSMNDTKELINNKYNHYNHVDGDPRYTCRNLGKPAKGTYHVDSYCTRVMTQDGTKKTYHYYRICWNKSGKTYKNKAWVNVNAFKKEDTKPKESTSSKGSTSSSTPSYMKPSSSTKKVVVVADKVGVVKKPDTSASPIATYPKGKILVVEPNVVEADGWKWVQYVNYQGITHYMKLISKDGKSVVTRFN